MEYAHRQPLREAITILGGQAALATAIGKKQGHIWFYLNEAQKLPPALAIKIELATEGKVSRDRLCPALSPEFQP